MRRLRHLGNVTLEEAVAASRRDLGRYYRLGVRLFQLTSIQPP